MFRVVFLCQLVLSVLGSVPECTRPVINHWLDDDSLKNESFTLFGDHPAHQKTIFFSLKDSGCQTNTGGKTRLFCNGYTFSLDCMKGDSSIGPHEIILGIGQTSVIWNHYKRMILSEESITFGDSNLKFDESSGFKVNCDRDSIEQSSLCDANNGEIVYGEDNQYTKSVKISFFGDTLATTVPPNVYSEIIATNRKVFHYKVNDDIDVVRCAENCIWSSDIWKENSNAILRGDKDYLVLGTLARQQLTIHYDADTHSLQVSPETKTSKYSKITSQLILIIKLGVLCFLGSTASVNKYNRNTAKLIFTVSIFLCLEILLFAHSTVFRITGIGQVALLLALNTIYDGKHPMGGQPQAVILALVLIQSTMIELSFFELSILALMAHSIIVISTLVRLLMMGESQLALLFTGLLAISFILTIDVLQPDIEEFTCLFGLQSPVILYIFFIEICTALSLEWLMREKIK